MGVSLGDRQSHSGSDLVMDCTANAFEFVEEPSLQMLTRRVVV